MMTIKIKVYYYIMEIAFVLLFALLAIGHYVAGRLHQTGLDITKRWVRFVCFSSLVLWLIPFIGIMVSSFTSTLGRKNKQTRLGKTYFIVGIVGFLLSFGMWMNNVSTWYQDLL